MPPHRLAAEFFVVARKLTALLRPSTIEASKLPGEHSMLSTPLYIGVGVATQASDRFRRVRQPTNRLEKFDTYNFT